MDRKPAAPAANAPCSSRSHRPAVRTAANPPHAAEAGERDRQTVGQTYRRTQYRYIDPAACHASTVNTEQTTVIIQHDLVNYEVAHVNYC